MPRILIDCTKIDFGRQPTGIPRVVLKYIEEGYGWAELSGHEIIPVIPTKDGVWLCRPVPGANVPQSLTEIARFSERFEQNKSLHFEGQDANAEIKPPHLILTDADDILFAPAYWHDNDPEIYHSIRLTGCKIAILVHDILPITRAHFYHSPWRFQFAAAVLQALTYADIMYCVSGTTKAAIETLAAQRGVTVPPITVAYNGFEPLVSTTIAKQMNDGSLTPHVSDAPSLKALTSDRPLLMVGSIEPKKGHIPVIKTLEAMWAAGYPHDLVIIGRRGWMEQEVVDYIHNSPCYGFRLFWLTSIDDFDLAYAYVHCHALIFASLDEGFGIPMIEAAAFDKPVVVFKTDIATEVLGHYAIFFNDASSLMEQLIALEDETTYQSACNVLKSFDWPTWEESVPTVLDHMIDTFNLSEKLESDTTMALQLLDTPIVANGDDCRDDFS